MSLTVWNTWVIFVFLCKRQMHNSSNFYLRSCESCCITMWPILYADTCWPLDVKYFHWHVIINFMDNELLYTNCSSTIQFVYLLRTFQHHTLHSYTEKVSHSIDTLTGRLPRYKFDSTSTTETNNVDESLIHGYIIQFEVVQLWSYTTGTLHFLYIVFSLVRELKRNLINRNKTAQRVT